jgi:hypothetical protein
MSNLFGNAVNDLAGAEKEKDVLGGRRKLFPTGAYDAKIDVAYVTVSQNGAKALNFIFKVGDQTHRETVYVTNRKGEVFYTKDNKKHALPGYSLVNALSKLAIGKELPQLAFEKKIVKIYDFNAKKEVPTEVEVAVELTGADINIGIENILENKQVKDQANNYVAIAETREVNEWTRVFHPKTGQTALEYDEQKEAEFKARWVAEFGGKQRDKTDKSLKASAPAAASSAPTSGTAATPGKSLFGG